MRLCTRSRINRLFDAIVQRSTESETANLTTALIDDIHSTMGSKRIRINRVSHNNNNTDPLKSHQ